VDRERQAEEMKFVGKLASGDEDALSEFQRRFQPRFGFIAAVRGVPAHECEDVARTAVLKGLDQIRRGIFRGKSRLSTWLEKVATGTIIDYLRAARGRLSSEVQIREDAYTACDEDQVLRVAVHEILARLTAQHRTVLVLKYVQELSAREIAARVGWSEAKVNQVLVQARAKFRKEFDARSVISPAPRLQIEGEK
jgi:RNA polymerase sigma-70 factor (ECF subfamily)